MNNRAVWLITIGVVMLLATILVLPLPYPTARTEELVDPTGIVIGTQQKPLERIAIASSSNLKGLLFWTASKTNISPDTIVELQIINVKTNEILRTTSQPFSEIFNSSAKTVRFLFPIVRNTSSSSLVALIKIQNASSSEILALRGTLQQPEDDTSAQVSVQVVEQRSVFSILYERVYQGKTDGEDIYYYWVRGGEVAGGGNPYVCSLDDTCINHKNPGHFPLFYLLSALSIKMGFHEFESWIALWRPIFFLSYLSIGAMLFGTLVRRKQYALAVFALFFWLGNRWSLYVIRVGHVDFFALFFLVLSLLLFEKKKIWSVLFFSISLSIKQVAIFLAPLYLVLLFVYTEPSKRRKMMSRYVLTMALVPLLSLAPFLIDNPGAVIKGLAFSATRNSEANMGATPLVSFLKIHGIAGVLPMAFLMALVYIAGYRKKLSLPSGGLAIMLVFLAFNTVTFNQYFLWFVPFLPLALSDSKPKLK